MNNLIKITLSFFFLFSAFTLNAQTIESSIVHDFSSPENTNPDSTNNEIRFVSAEATEIIVAGHIVAENGSQKVYTGAFDYAGNLLWKKTMTLPSGFVTMELATNENLKKTSDGHFAIAGLLSTTIESDTARIPFLYVFDGNTGDSLNFQQYNEPVWKLGSLIVDDQGNFVMGGLIDKNVAGSFPLDYAKVIWLTKINSTGSIIWHKESNSGVVTRLYNLQNILDFGNEYILVMSLVSNHPYIMIHLEDNAQSLLDIYSSVYINDNVNWSFNLVTASLNGEYFPDIDVIRKKNHSGFYFLSAAIDNSFNMAGAPRGWYYGDVDNQLDAPHTWYNGFSMLGHPEYNNDSLGLYMGLLNRGGLRIREGINGDLILLQNATTKFGFNNFRFTPFVMRTDAQGIQKWRNYFLYVPDIFLKLNHKLNDVSIAPDGKIVMGGSVESDSLFSELSITKKGTISWLLVLNDSVHDTPNSIQVLPADLSNRINLYPNPSVDKINLSYKDIRIQGLKLVDVIGRVVKTFPATAKILNVGDMAPGTYSLQIVTDKGKTAKMVVVQ